MDKTTLNEEKTFSQDELNAIIGERLAKEKTKLESEFAEREQALLAKELMMEATAKLTEMNLPVELLNALNISTPEAMSSSFDIVKKVLGEIKSRPVELKGVTPFSGPGRSSDGGDGGDSGIRKAMGLIKE